MKDFWWCRHTNAPPARDAGEEFGAQNLTARDGGDVQRHERLNHKYALAWRRRRIEIVVIGLGWVVPEGEIPVARLQARGKAAIRCDGGGDFDHAGIDGRVGGQEFERISAVGEAGEEEAIPGGAAMRV